MAAEIDDLARRAAELVEGTQRFSLEIGGKTAAMYKKELKKAGIAVIGIGLLESPDFTTLSEPQTVDLVKMRVSDLGFEEVATTDQIFRRAQEIGLQLCPAEVGPAQRLADKEQELGNWYAIGMEPIIYPNTDRPMIFALEHGELGWMSWFLHCTWAEPGRRWSPETQIVFNLGKPNANGDKGNY
ncbi:MAG: hypothetical protein A2798_03905 [Candidatus Levybacteria bacterium RIFCSPHIGHO2_01_FULL_37_17]|nr:MAG: hypothetical protein A2798_03905 [Candidatus Levybacteria bacterium RIFCSPHIGHO2_01_FULL_37_17]OGH36612.1 MAG: hypothetical protein A2959_03960 [Candidatus Levybacteria bacterium RIFCSPLOWO2_01_FULL_38_23]